MKTDGPRTGGSALRRNEVDIWMLDLHSKQLVEAELVGLLSTDEKERAARFYFERDRRRFEICRGSLRRILSRYTDCEPAKIQFGHNAFGKPFVGGSEVEGIEFNVSHSGDRALIAVAHRPVGVDLEECKMDFEWRDVASHFCNLEELAALESLRTAARRRLFFKLWTCKEALVKAAGVGVGGPLGRINALASSGEIEMNGRSYFFQDLAGSENWAGAVALEGGAPSVQMFALPSQEH